jgi:septum formation protein
VLDTAIAKCEEVYKREIDNDTHPKGEVCLVLSADTIIISHMGKILEKPRSEIEHIQMLQMLRDEGTHKVVTAVCVMAPTKAATDPGYKQETHVEETTVKFDPNGTQYCTLNAMRYETIADMKFSDGRPNHRIREDPRRRG